MIRFLVKLLLILLICPTSYAGHTVVLIHGYLSDSSEWYSSGIVYALQRAGWWEGGHLLPSGPVLRPIPSSHSIERYVYSVTLPSEAPLPIQAQWLDFYLDYVRAEHPHNQLILVGHSAGGVVARLSMVRGNLPIAGLITIASPHLGTSKAETAAMLSDSPLGWIAPFVGLGTLNRSEELYWDLVREYPETPLFWLNREPHPDAFYISIVRVGADRWVPPYSQDLNDVPALRGKALTITSVGTHSLQAADGPVLASLLETVLSSSTHPDKQD